ncbi:imelysin family protein [Dongia deserti]|uniref:imelysin family protein n=1 Tax=Dongia deserti TaxID=2268030 RepID=UPI000E648905|nr:imelysin family protein [Dongia deserti]
MIRAIAASILLLIATHPALALEDADYSAAVAATAKTVIIPSYRAFGERAESLQAQLDALCKQPSEAALKGAQQQFAAVAAAWAQIQYISFGPIFEHQRAFRIEYWPDKRNVVGRQLAEVLKEQDRAALEPKRFATTTVGVQGLPALERLLFADDALAELNGPNTSFRCSLFDAIGNNLKTIARDVVTGWTEGESSFLSRIEHPSENDEEVPSGRDAAGRLLNDLLTATIAMRDMKLLAPLGSALEKAKPHTAEYWRSGQSIAVLTTNVDGWRDLFGAKQGLGALLSAQPDGKQVADDVRATVDRAAHELAQVGMPLDKAVADPTQRKQVEAFAAELMKLRDLLAGPVTTTLNLPIGFNALDGD